MLGRRSLKSEGFATIRTENHEYFSRKPIRILFVNSFYAGHIAKTVTETTDTIEIAPGIYWVGKRDPNSLFHSNPYLRVFKDEQGRALSILVDPGSSSDFAVVYAKVSRILGDISRLSAVFVNHQDPDVGSSATQFLGRYAQQARLICSEETWRLIVHTNLPRDRLIVTNNLQHNLIRLQTGHVLSAVPSPFCHFRGAVMLYDHEHRVLFSGDLFGGLTEAGDTSMWATEADWRGIRAFHQLYMPTNQALARTIATIRRLDPPVHIIAPQHGRLLHGSLLTEFMSRIERLPVGLDVLDDDEASLPGWNSVLDRVMDTARLVLGNQAELRVTDRASLNDTISFDGWTPRIIALGRWSIGEVVAALTEREPAEIANPIKLQAIHSAMELNLPTPEIQLTQTEGRAPLLMDDQGRPRPTLEYR